MFSPLFQGLKGYKRSHLHIGIQNTAPWGRLGHGTDVRGSLPTAGTAPLSLTVWRGVITQGYSDGN